MPENSLESGLMEGGRIGYIAPDALQEGDVERLMEELRIRKASSWICGSILQYRCCIF